MKKLFRQLVSFSLPITVLILIPLWIERNFKIHFGLLLLVGFLIIGAGLSILVMNIIAFIHRGKGTLAPWSPTKKLVITGMYAYVRNPMISGVFIVLLGEALTFLSWRILLWAIAFFLINTLYFILYEEPDLEKKFEEEYHHYKKNVPRWIPKLKPYEPV